MSSLLSSLAVQKYELILPTSKKRIEYRPFLVKEEKILMLASESKDQNDMYRAMKEVVAACTFGSIDVETTPIIDIEYIFLRIRSRSVGETATPAIKCFKCNKSTEVKIDLNKIEPTHNEEHKNRVTVNDQIVMDMKYPTFSDLQKVEEHTNEFDKAISLLISCIDKVHTKNETFTAKEIERSDLEEFVVNFNQDQLKRAMKFVETMPKLQAVLDFTCSHCQYKEKMKLEGIRDFF
jgi:hypothetical protein